MDIREKETQAIARRWRTGERTPISGFKIEVLTADMLKK
jgi:hypothetical protein